MSWGVAIEKWKEIKYAFTKETCSLPISNDTYECCFGCSLYDLKEYTFAITISNLPDTGP